MHIHIIWITCEKRNRKPDGDLSFIHDHTFVQKGITIVRGQMLALYKHEVLDRFPNKAELMKNDKYAPHKLLHSLSCYNPPVK